MRSMSVLIAGWSALFLLLAPSIARAEETADEKALIAFLNKAYHHGAFTFGTFGRDDDGNYISSQTLKQLWDDRKKIGSYCESVGGQLELVVSAANLVNRSDRTTLNFGDRSYEVSRDELYTWSGNATPSARESGYDDVLDRRLWINRDKIVPRADGDPPLGLFRCIDGRKKLKWAVSIMPGRLILGRQSMEVRVLPLTVDFVAAKKAPMLRAEEYERKFQQSRIDRERELRETLARENVRLAPWRKELTIGSQTNCGLVINVRGSLVEVQLPHGYSATNGERQFWIKRDDVTDASPPTGCKLGS